MRPLHAAVFAITLTSTVVFAQSGNTTAGLAGIGAGAALGASSGTGSTTSSSGGSAPMEVQVMSFYELEKIATEIAGLTATGVCKEKKTDCPVLIEDAVSSNQLALYHTAEGYDQRLSALNTQFQTALPITVIALPSSLTAVAGTTPPQSVLVPLLKNLAGKALTIKDNQVTLSGNLDNAFTAQTDPATCDPVAPRATCNLVLTFSPPANAADGKTYTAVAAITYADASGSNEQITFPISGTARAAAPPAPPAPAAPPISLTPQQKNDILKNGTIHFDAMTRDQLLNSEKSIQIAAVHKGITREFALGGGGGAVIGEAIPPPAPAAAPAAAGAATSSAAASSPSPAAPPATPYSVQWTNGLTTDAGTAKSGMAYSSASASPTSQAFAALVEKELTKVTGYTIHPYTSSSPLNLGDATTYMTTEFGRMLAVGSDVTTWTNECSKSTNGPATPQSSSAAYTACNNPDVVANLAIAAQLTASYSTLLTTASDGNGNPVIVDILRGRALTKLAGDQVPSLQLAVLGAGGSTKTDNFFGVSLFYQFAPSYNAGVLAAFELRNGQDQFVDAGVRNVLYGYKKWNPGHMSKTDHKNVDTHQDDCGFCSSQH